MHTLLVFLTRAGPPEYRALPGVHWLFSYPKTLKPLNHLFDVWSLSCWSWLTPYDHAIA